MSPVEKIKQWLAKGSLQRKMKFKNVESPHAAGWMHDNVSESRESLPRAEGNERSRMLHKLHGLTQVKKNPDGTRSFLMHRGMDAGEVKSKVKGKKFSSETRTSWSPDKEVAQIFASHNTPVGEKGHVVSAWVHENHIHSMPSMQLSKKNRIGHAAPGEKEFVVNHNQGSDHSPIHSHEKIEGDLHQSMAASVYGGKGKGGKSVRKKVMKKKFGGGTLSGYTPKKLKNVKKAHSDLVDWLAKAPPSEMTMPTMPNYSRKKKKAPNWTPDSEKPFHEAAKEPPMPAWKRNMSSKQTRAEQFIAKSKEILQGGYGDGMPDSMFDKKQLKAWSRC